MGVGMENREDSRQIGMKRLSMVHNMQMSVCGSGFLRFSIPHAESGFLA